VIRRVVLGIQPPQHLPRPVTICWRFLKHSDVASRQCPCQIAEIQGRGALHVLGIGITLPESFASAPKPISASREFENLDFISAPRAADFQAEYEGSIPSPLQAFQWLSTNFSISF